MKRRKRKKIEILQERGRKRQGKIIKNTNKQTNKRKEKKSESDLDKERSK